MKPIPSLRPLLLLAALLLGFPGIRLVAQTATGDPAGLVGTWRLLRVDNILPDGRRVQPYGPDPVGLLVFDAAGNYAVQILRANRLRFAGNDKSNGSAEEYRSAVQGTNSHFGRYEVRAAVGELLFKIDHASYPNWEGTTQTRLFTVQGDELRYIVPSPTTGTGATSEVVWRRAKQKD